jgi:hypothetical protein
MRGASGGYHLNLYVRLANEFFSATSAGAVRYNANLLQSTTVRLTTVTGKMPANLFGSRKDALDLVEASQQGRIMFDRTDSDTIHSAACSNGVNLTFDRKNNIIEVQAPNVEQINRSFIETEKDVHQYLQEVTTAWKKLTGASLPTGSSTTRTLLSVHKHAKHTTTAH